MIKKFDGTIFFWRESKFFFGGGRGANERPGTDHMASGLMRGLAKQTEGHGNSITELAQWGRFGENHTTFEKSLIRETKNLSTDGDSSTDTKKILLVKQNSPKRRKKLRSKFTHFYEHTFLDLRQLLPPNSPQGFQKSKKFGHKTLGIWAKRRLNRVNK